MTKWKPKINEIYYFPFIHGEVGGRCLQYGMTVK